MLLSYKGGHRAGFVVQGERSRHPPQWHIWQSADLWFSLWQWRSFPCSGIRWPCTAAVIKVKVRPTLALWVGWHRGSYWTSHILSWLYSEITHNAWPIILSPWSIFLHDTQLKKIFFILCWPFMQPSLHHLVLKQAVVAPVLVESNFFRLDHPEACWGESASACGQWALHCRSSDIEIMVHCN